MRDPRSQEPLVRAAQDAGADAPCGDRVDNIAVRLRLLSPTAIRAFELVLERFELGQRTYGEPRRDRDWRGDTLEELLDLCVYRGLTLACADPVERGLHELATNAPEEDSP